MRGKIHQRVVDRFLIGSLQDWKLLRASDILSVPGVGKGYLNKLRLWLAHQSLNLKNDNPPSYWLDLHKKKEEAGEISGVCPFTVVRDTNESLPFMFMDQQDKDGLLIKVPIEVEPMYQVGLADYSIKGMLEEIQIERKSFEDLVGTLSSRRESFEEEICRLDGLCSFAAIVCEAEWSNILVDQHDHGARAKSVSRTMLSWSIKYPRVHWIMCAGRAHAENVTFRLLQNYWWQAQREDSRSESHGQFTEFFKL